MTSSFGNDGWGDYQDPMFDNEPQNEAVFDKLGNLIDPNTQEGESSIFALYMWMLWMNGEVSCGMGYNPDGDPDFVFALPEQDWKEFK